MVTAALSIVPPGQKRDDAPMSFRRERGPMVEILSPSPESLGLRELHIGGGVRRARKTPVGPVKEGVFAATLRVTFVRPVYMDRKRSVVPVRIAPKPWPDSNGGSNAGERAYGSDPRLWGFGGRS
jgi:hypothetical protein